MSEDSVKIADDSAKDDRLHLHDIAKNLKVKLAKILMKFFPSTPQYTVRSLLSEVINHRSFLDDDEAKRNKILFEMAQAHYWNGQIKPFDLFYPNIPLKKVLQGEID